MKKYKYIILTLLLVILSILGIIIYARFFEEKIIFTLFGDKEVTLYEGNPYFEVGYIALNESGENISNLVEVDSNLNINKVGKYIIKYKIKSQFRSYKEERIINVVPDNLKEVTFKLNGPSIVNLQIGRVYDDPRFECVHKITGENLTKYVVIENGVNNKKEGTYEIKYRLRYNGKEKVLIRKVYVFKQTNSHTLSTTSLTNKPVSIKFRSYIYNFAYVVCPNDNIIYNSVFSYNFFENGKYSFYVYDSMNNYEEYVVTISNIDKVAPKGTCSASLANGKTSYVVKSSDDDLDRLLYDGDEKYASSKKNIVIDKYQRQGIVTLVDKAGNRTKVKCDVKRAYTKVINPKKDENVKYKASSDSLVINVSYKDGYYLTRIWAKDPYLQLRKEMLSESSKSLKLPKTILEQAISKYNLKNKIVWSANASGPVLKGSHYSYVAKANPFYNLKEPSSLLVYNGKVIINDYKEYAGNTSVYYINASNQLSYIHPMENNSVNERKKAFEKALDSGIYNTFAFNPVLVIDGKVQKVSADYYALRNGFCQIDENNFISIVSDTKKWHKQDFANFMGTLGCKTAVNFDGGGSVALFYKEKNSNNIKTLTGNGRALSSVLYFTEL